MQGLGSLSVYVDDMTTPALVVPMNLAQGFEFVNNQPYVGFTASTGEKAWQTVDIEDWRFCGTGTNCDASFSLI